MSFFQLHAHKSFSHMNIIQANQDYCVLFSFILKYSAFYLKLVKQKFSEAEIDHLDQTNRRNRVILFLRLKTQNFLNATCRK